jgi:hypothetical protein
MPVTQHFWTWDHFLSGGYDFELTTLLVLSFLGMALVLSRQSKQCLDLLFAVWRFLCFLFDGVTQGRAFMPGAFSVLYTDWPSSRSACTYCLPLKI